MANQNLSFKSDKANICLLSSCSKQKRQKGV